MLCFVIGMAVAITIIWIILLVYGYRVYRDSEQERWLK
jgi:hypothetical protein